MSPVITPGEVTLMPSGGTGANVLWVRDEFRCTCSDLYYCHHIRRFFQNGGDVGQHTVISRSRLHEVSHLYLPLMNRVRVRVKLTVVEHPVNKSEVMLYVCEDRDGAEVSAYMSREDSFEPFIRALRDHYMSLPLTLVCFNKIFNRKRPPCPNHKHNRAADVYLAKEVAHIQLSFKDNHEKLELEFAEMAIENAYNITVGGMCSGCLSSQIDPANVPDDLIPSL